MFLRSNDSNTGVFLWILWNFYEQLFYRTPSVTASALFALYFQVVNSSCVVWIRELLFKWIDISCLVSGPLPSEENCPPVTVGVWVNVRVSFRVGGQPENYPQGKLPPVRVRVWVRVSSGVWGQFSLGAIVLELSCLLICSFIFVIFSSKVGILILIGSFSSN